MMSNRSRRLLLAGAALVLVALLVVACGRDRDNEPAQPTATSSPTSEDVPPANDPPQESTGSTPVPTATAQSPLPTPTLTPATRSLFLPAVPAENVDPTPAAEPTEPPQQAEDLAAPEQAGEDPEPPRQMTLRDWPALTLPEWPRPANDNGLCLHNITEAYYHEENLDLQISRLKRLNMPWTLLLYGDENQIMKAAPRFRDAGITVIWRKMLRPDERYFEWERDIELIRSFGMEPYMQLYNEPSLPAEWEEDSDQELFLANLVQAVEYVYNAGGYVGLQFVSDEWLVAALQAIKRHGGEQVFGRTFLVPHPYGLNHPPDYVEDTNGVLGFLHQAEVVRNELGFVPPMIAGEGGWKWNATDDRRYPPIDADLHRDYHVAVFDWFRTGTLSNGEPLPDYLFAFCPWLLSSKLDDSAWFDSFAGDHTPTIEAVEAMSRFERRFNWQQ